MVKHSTEALPQRRLEPTGTLFHPQNPFKFPEKELVSGMSRAQAAFIIGDLVNWDRSTLCASCYEDLPEGPQPMKAIWPDYYKLCAVCKIVDIKPEAFTRPFCRFLQQNPTVFHAVNYFTTKMTLLGYKELSPREDWAGKIEPGGKYFVTRNGSSVIAFTVGKAYKPGNGVAMIAGHIDALTARLKPVSVKPTKAGYVQLGVAPYAGALNQTWWDRDLSIGGRVTVRDKSGKTSNRLVKIERPIARIPTLAPHFGVGMMGQNNKETEAVPIIGLDGSSSSFTGGDPAQALGPAGSFVSKQPPKLVKLIAGQLGIADYGQILNWDLELFDVQPATVGGLDEEFIFGGRIDDKLCSWAALQGLLLSDQKDDDGVIKLVALFDDEEIGSLLRQGAKGNFLPSVIERTVESLCANSDGNKTTTTAYGPGVMGQTLARSFLVSADVTHAVNPNFLARYQEDHAPRLNVGICVCADSNGHMTTDAVSTAILARVCELGGCAPPQLFQIRNDSRSGGTVGPSLSSALGVRAADAGMPQLSMHSIRATCGALDPGLGVKFFKAFLDKFEEVDGEWAR
ncbi:aminopeptidase-like protein [Xylariaceae sp. FL0594]|nr:aminopeptidase-like protein [Xylariaceae sp. FL0594]